MKTYSSSIQKEKVSISSPSSEGGGISYLDREKLASYKFPLVLLQAKVVGYRMESVHISAGNGFH